MQTHRHEKLGPWACRNLFPVQEIGLIVPCVDAASENTSCIIKIYHTSIAVLHFHSAYNFHTTIQQE